MSNMTALKLAVSRAKRCESSRKSFDEDMQIKVPTQVLLFAQDHIIELNKKLLELEGNNDRLHEYCAFNDLEVMKRIIDAGMTTEFIGRVFNLATEEVETILSL